MTHLDDALRAIGIDLSKEELGRCRSPIGQSNCLDTPDLGRSEIGTAIALVSPTFASAGGTRLRLAASPRAEFPALMPLVEQAEQGLRAVKPAGHQHLAISCTARRGCQLTRSAHSLP